MDASRRRLLLATATAVGAAGTATVAAAAPASAATTATTDWINVTAAPYNATGDGTTDDTAAINSALKAAPSGGVVYLPTGVYATSAPLVVPPGVTLQGTHGIHLDEIACSVKPLATHAGPAVVQFLDQATGGYSAVSNEQRVFDLTIDGSRLAAGNTVDGIQAVGYVHGVVIQDVSISHVGGHGIAAVGNSSGSAYSWRGTRISAIGCGSYGFSLGMTDSTWIDLESIASGKSGFYIANTMNSQFIGCRSEWSTYHGFEITGAWSTGNGSGGCLFSNLSTDHNSRHGVVVAATGHGPLVFNGLMLRRDGANPDANGLGQGGGGYAGFAVASASMPVVVTGITVFPGIHDNGTGANAPEYGISATGSSFVSVSGGFVQAATAPVFDGGGNTFFRVDPGLGLATGPTTAPVAADDNQWGVAGSAGAAFGVGVTAADRIALSLANSSSNVNQPLLHLQTGGSAADGVIKSSLLTDAHTRFTLGVDGRATWGDGVNLADTALYRAAAGVVRTDGALSAGQGLRVTEGGSSARMGTVVLNGTTEVRIATTAVTTSSRIFLTVQAPGGTVSGAAYVSSRTAGASFGVKAPAGDTSTLAWMIVEPA